MQVQVSAICDKMVAMPKKRFADDYEIVVNTDAQGHEKKVAVYRGEYFKLTPKDINIAAFKNRCLLLLTTIVVLHISSGFVNNRGMNQFYVALPYVLAFLPMFFMGRGIFRLPKEKLKYQRDELGLSFVRLKNLSIPLITLLIMVVLGEILFLLIVSNESHPVLEYLHLCLEGAAVFAAYFITSLQKNIHVEPYLDENQK
jgi:hypothetical protein